MIKRFFLCLAWSLILLPLARASSIDSLENVLKSAQGSQKVKVMNELFGAYLNNDPVKAVGYAKQALALATSIDDKKGMAASYNNLGVAYRNQGALDLALEHYLQSLTLYESIQNAEGSSTTKNNIANIYTIKKDYGQALKYFEESRKGFIELGDQSKIIGSLTNLGNLHADMQRYVEARHYYEEALAMSEKSGKVLPEPLINLGGLNSRQGNYPMAIEYYRRALDLAREQQDKISQVHIATSLGGVYMQAGRTSDAEELLSYAYKTATELQAYMYYPQILKSMAANYFKQGKSKEAYEILLKYDEAREKVYGEESTRRIAQMDLALKLREKETEIEQIERDNEVKTLKLRNIEFIITAVVLGLVALLAVGNLYFMGGRRKKAA